MGFGLACRNWCIYVGVAAYLTPFIAFVSRSVLRASLDIVESRSNRGE